MQQPLASIPSPSQGVVHLGPLPLRGYALMIILGVIVAVWLGERRWVARGGTAGTVVDIAVWAVPFGLVGGRLYHVITDYQLYFGKNWHPVGALEVWNGGLGIWGAVAAGTLGAYLGCRRRGISLRAFADAAAPGIALAQAIGRWGNWFNQELYGRPSKLPWAVKIDPAHRPPKTPDIATYHPTFLYESLWCIGVALLVIWAEKRFRLAYGRTFALYVAAYTVGRAWTEWLRVDPAHHVLGLRLNDWTALIVFLGAAAYLYFYRDRTEIPEGAVGTPAPAPEPESEPEPESDAESAAATEPETAEPEEPAKEEASEETVAEEKAPEAEAAEEKASGEPEDKTREAEASNGEAPEAPEEPGTGEETAADEAPETLEDDAESAEDETEGEAGQGGEEAEEADKGDGREKASTGAEPGEGK
ncbi:prolipoprotein diacylglyceryl transferase [Actinoallomurus acaciae]|uniref:Phosphatidylglycerol--prolipoprotein diacylglyceryl transferase n=1 Tax=Actinoallomurus acaciae TaxID=502577 RepID=A0ABV5YFM6_9ACTN